MKSPSAQLSGTVSAFLDVVLEVIANDAFVDFVKEGFDAGIRLEESLDQDMTAIVAVSRDFETTTMASPITWKRMALRWRPKICRRMPLRA